MYVSLRGRVVADFGFGEARPGVPLTPDSLTLWLSSGKPLTAVALAMLWDDGQLDLDDPVARHIPGFEREGKAAVTLRHLLTHTAGLRHVKIDIEAMSWDQIIEKAAASPLEAGWVPGKRAGYHMGVTWFLLAEVVRRLTGLPFGQFLQESIYGPLGMQDCHMGMSAATHARLENRMVAMYDTSAKGQGKRHVWDQLARASVCAPSGNGWGPIRALGYFYEMLLGRGERAGVRVMSAQAVEALTAPHRVGLMDETFKHGMDWGLGMMVNSLAQGRETQPYGFGPHASRRVFGHGGYQSSLAFGDPEHGLAVAFVTNGTCGEGRHGKRCRELVTLLYEDLSLI